MSRLQGFVLLSSDRGGIRIEYAKNKIGEVVRLEIYTTTRLSLCSITSSVNVGYSRPQAVFLSNTNYRLQ